MRYIDVRPQATADLEAQFEYLVQQNEAIALRFFDAARQTFADLARMPEMGRTYSGSGDRLQNLRQWKIKGFKKFLIFYRVQPDAIEIVRVLNAAQDIQSILESDF